MLTYTLKKSRRKTIAITVDKDGNLIVKAPLNATKQRVDAFIREQQDWILKHMAIQKTKSRERNIRLNSPPQKILYLGKFYPVLHKAPYGFDGNSFMLPEMPMNNILNGLTDFYIKSAKSYIPERVEYFSKIIGVSPLSVRIGSAKTRWGSCSGRKSLNFTWKLMLADESVIDYVVVHELCHILQMNHSNKFWAEVEKIIPDYKAKREQLKKLQSEIALMGYE